MSVSRILILGLMTVGLTLAVNQPAWAHPPEEHSAAPVAAEPVTPEPVATIEATIDEVSPHEHGTIAGPGHHDEPISPQNNTADAHDDALAAPHGHDMPTMASQHDESAPHEHEGATQDAHGTAGHSHWGDNGANTPVEKALERLGVFHPLLVHFPIALILAAALAQALNLAGVRASNADTVRFLVWTGAFGGLAAGLFGWAHAGPMASDEAGIMLAHRWIGSSLTLGLFAVAAAVEWNRKSPSGQSAIIMNLALFTAAAAVAVNGFLGGSLAHGGVNHLMEM
ncbi:DUF2231 domain-containing protein [uncultured Maricaulis sp.]|uniref:DUF2231 domain-containing protein n=1 Tax=uncultured Maricaulis sp. TaxID=174710 RepID=UPI0030DB412A